MKIFPTIKKNISIAPEKKEQMWASIVDNINISEISSEENVRIEDLNRHTWWGTKSKPSSLFTNHKNMVIAAKIIASILVGSMAGASVLAEQALPGDVLYSFKVDVNESIRWAFTFGTEADAKWEVKKLERRAGEKTELEVREGVTPRAQAIIVTEANASSDKAHEALTKLRSQGRAEVATSLDASLKNSIKVINTTNSGITMNEDEDDQDENEEEVEDEDDQDEDDENEENEDDDVRATVKSNTSINI